MKVSIKSGELVVDSLLFCFDDNGIEYCSSSEKIFCNAFGLWDKCFYDINGNHIGYLRSTGYWWKKIYDPNGEVVHAIDSSGSVYKKTYDSNGRELTYITSGGFSSETTYGTFTKRTIYNDGTSNLAIDYNALFLAGFRFLSKSLPFVFLLFITKCY